MNKKTSVLFVCMGNICRSPTAQGVFEKVLEEEGLRAVVEVDSAGTHAYHVGEPPDQRAQETARQRGVDLGSQRARRFAPEDFSRFDYILVMDEDNLSILEAGCPPEHRAKLSLLMDFAPGSTAREVPDPYYGGRHGFDRVFNLVEEAARGLVSDIRQRQSEKHSQLGSDGVTER